MYLSDLTNKLKFEYILNSKEVEISGICCDTRKLTPGSLFVCIKGTGDDGHKYINEAIEKKASAIITEKETDVTEVPVIQVADSRKALAEAAAAFYDYPSKKLKVIGVTGTNGKTSVSFMIKNILEQCGYKVGLIGTVCNMIGEETYPASLTTPDAIELNSLFSQMADKNVNYAVMEVSSHSLSQNRVYGIDFAVGVLTNITTDHMDYYNTPEEYAFAKAKLFKMCEISVINRCDSHFELIKENSKGHTVTYGKDCEDTDVCAFDALSNINGVSFNVKTKDDYFCVHTEIPGCFTVDNALAAVSVAVALKIPAGFIRMAFKKLKGVKGRIEKVETGKDFSVFIDYAHTPDGLEKILNTVNDFKEGRLITVFGCGGDRDKSKRPVMGKIASELSDFVIVTSDNPRTENGDNIIKDIVKGIEKDNYKTVTDRKEAIKVAVAMAKKDDIILLAGKGHETCQILSDGKIHFDEREILKELL